MDVGGVAGSTRSKLDRTTKLLTLNRLRRRSAASGGRRFRPCLCVSVPEASCQTARRGYYEDSPLDIRKKKTRERGKKIIFEEASVRMYNIGRTDKATSRDLWTKLAGNSRPYIVTLWLTSCAQTTDEMKQNFYYLVNFLRPGFHLLFLGLSFIVRLPMRLVRLLLF